MRVRVVSLLAVSTIAALACRSAQQSKPAGAPAVSPRPEASSTPGAVAQAPAAAGAPGAPGAGGPPRRPRPSAAALDTMRRGMVARMLTEIAGRENEPAENVYKNIKLWKGIPARALLDTMNSYGRAIGQTCTGCHVAGQWASDDRKNKVIAREMQLMVNDINKNQLSKMPDLDDDHPPATCGMCHNGSGHPRTQPPLDGAPAGPPPGMRPPGN